MPAALRSTCFMSHGLATAFKPYPSCSTTSIPSLNRATLRRQRLHRHVALSAAAARGDDVSLPVPLADVASGKSRAEEAITATSDASARRVKRKRVQVEQAVEPSTVSQPVQQRPSIAPFLGLAAALVAGGAIWAHKNGFFQTATTMWQSGKQVVEENMSQKQLQREAMGRLNQMSDQLKSLATVDLSAKNLGDEGTAYVVEGLAFNHTCLALDLSKNGIAAAGMAQLAEVLPGCKLQTLSLSTNNLCDEGAETLAKVLSGNENIYSLNLANNGIGNRGAAALAEALKLNTHLARLDLSGNNIDREGAAALAEALAVNTSLEALYINENYLGEEGAAALAGALRQNSSIKELHIKGNELGDKGAGELCEALLVRSAELQVLDIGNNSICEEGASSLARLLLAKAGSIKDFVMYMNDIGDAGVARLATALRECKVLKHLDLGGNNIGPEGLTSLAASLKGHPCLATLELGYNPLGEAGTKVLTDLAKYDLKALTSLRMGWCKVGGGEGARAVSDLLMYNTRLVSLDLRGNGLGNDGIIFLSRGIRGHENKHLSELDLGYNEIKDDGACALAQALKANAEGAVKDLRLNNNYITRFGQVALSEAVDMVYEMGGGKVTTVHL